MATVNHQAVTVIGLGDMGRALAKALLQSGSPVTVWNRSAEKAAPLEKMGATVAATVKEAVKGADIIIVCVVGYEVTKELLGATEIYPELNGRILIEFSTGTPQDAREAAHFFRASGVSYLDGAILATPAQIGKAYAPIFVSGEKAAFEKAAQPLSILGGGMQFMGEGVGLAAAWDLAILSGLFGGLLGFIHGSRVCELEGIPVAAYGNAMQQMMPVMGELFKGMGTAIATNDFENPDSSVNTCVSGITQFMRHAKEAQIPALWPEFAYVFLKTGQDAGFGDQKLSSLIKIMR